MEGVRVECWIETLKEGVHTTVRSSNPGERRDVGEVAGVQVPVGGVAELIAAAIAIVNS